MDTRVGTPTISSVMPGIRGGFSGYDGLRNNAVTHVRISNDIFCMLGFVAASLDAIVFEITQLYTLEVTTKSSVMLSIRGSFSGCDCLRNNASISSVMFSIRGSFSGYYCLRNSASISSVMFNICGSHSGGSKPQPQVFKSRRVSSTHCSY